MLTNRVPPKCPKILWNTVLYSKADGNEKTSRFFTETPALLIALAKPYFMVEATFTRVATAKFWIFSVHYFLSCPIMTNLRSSSKSCLLKFVLESQQLPSKFNSR